MVSSDSVVIRHRHFLIRKYAVSDAPALVRYFGHPAVIRGVRGQTWNYRRSDARKFLRERLTDYRRRGKRPGYAIEIQGGLVGGVGVTLGRHSAEIGYWLAKPYWSQGIMTAVVRDWTEYVFRRYKLKRVEAKVFPFNRASARVLQKNKFRFHVRLVHSYKTGRRFLDELVFTRRH